MQIWVEKARLGDVCAAEGCIAEVMVGGTMVRTKTGAGVVAFHPECWIAAAEELASVVDAKSKRLAIGTEDRVLRLSLLRRFSAVNQRINLYRERMVTEPENKRLPLMILRLQLTKEQYRRKIAEVGGVPRSWNEESGVAS